MHEPSSVRGRNRSASGAAGSCLAKRSFTASRKAPSIGDDVGAFGRRKPEDFRRQFRIALDIGELDDGGLRKLVAQFHRLQSRLAEAEANALECRVLGFRNCLEPIEPFLWP